MHALARVNHQHFALIKASAAASTAWDRCDERRFVGL
jgi:hypothetical protein